MGYNWKNLREAKIWGKGNYLAPGNFVLKLLKAYTIDTRNKGSAFIVEFEVLESDNPKIVVGTTKSWYQGLNDKDIAFSAIKEFLFYAFGVDQSNEEEVSEFESELEEMMEDVADEDWQNKKGDEHPFHGNVIGVECYEKKTVKNNRDFLVHNWQTVD